jgi:hypothetical protein
MPKKLWELNVTGGAGSQIARRHFSCHAKDSNAVGNICRETHCQEPLYLVAVDALLL